MVPVSGARSTDEAIKKQKPARAKGTKKDKKKWCKGKVGNEHEYGIGLPNWAKSGPYKEWRCAPWDTVVGLRWYCRHDMVCSKCGRHELLPSIQCPDRPEDDGTIEFYER